MTPCQPEQPASARSPQAVRLLHLSARAQFQALLQTRPLARTLHFALHGLANHQETDRSALFAPAGSLWIGVITPKRRARRAVTRNLVRRQVYGAGQAGWPPGAWLVRLRSEFDRRQFPSAASPALRQAVRQELDQLRAQALALAL